MIFLKKNRNLLGTSRSTHSTDAFLVSQTFTGCRASRRRIAASHFGVTDQPFQAATLGAMVDSCAFGVGSASGRRCASRYALGVETSVGHGTIRIGSASHFAASHRTDFTARTVRVLSADGHAHSLTAALVDQALRVGRAQRAAHGVLTSESSCAALCSGTGCWFSYASLFDYESINMKIPHNIKVNELTVLAVG